MILVCGIPSEAPLRLVIEAAGALDVPCVIFNQRETGAAEIALSVTGGGAMGVLRLGTTDWPLEAFDGTYVRLMDCAALPENALGGRSSAAAKRAWKSSLLHETLSAWLEMGAGRVMNRPAAMTSNVSKPYQAQAIASAGFAIPPTLISNEPAEVRAFLAEHGRVIFKSISAVRSIVRPLADVKLLDLERVRLLPTQFQAFVPGVNIRVHVAGEALFATEIVTEAIDYRYAGQEGLAVEMAPVDLPPAMAAGCRELARRLDLPLCGIDLKRTPGGEYYCFEVNPSPGFSFYQERTGQDIAAAIVRYLAGDG